MAKPAFHITMSGVASLARVKRPVVSTWRSRSASSTHPFPSPVRISGGQELFDASEVSAWLSETNHGNNPSVIEDAPAFSTPVTPGDDPGADFDGLTALVALRASSGRHLAPLDVSQLASLACEIDPDDTFLNREISGLGSKSVDLAMFVDAMVDGAYTPDAAFEILMNLRFRDGRRELTRGALSREAVSLVASTALELGRSEGTDFGAHPITIIDPTGASGDLIVGVLEQAGESRDISIATADRNDSGARLLRRRLAAHSIPRTGFDFDNLGAFAVTGRSVHLAQYPSPTDSTASPFQMLSAIESITLQMDDNQRGVVIAPASVLIEAQADAACATLRSDILRSNRVRAIVRLPQGHSLSSPRVALALWILGPSHASVPIAERWAVVADLSSDRLSPVVIQDLVSDLGASTGDLLGIRSHAFRFARFVSARSLLARTGSLVSPSTEILHTAQVDGRPVDLLVRRAASTLIRIDETIEKFARPLEPLDISASASSSGESLPSVSISDLLDARHLRYLPGTRVSPDDIRVGAAGLSVVGVDELAGISLRPLRSVDRLTFASKYPAASLTEPGDVIFCTGAGSGAIVDREGAKVVVYPARILRPNQRDTAGMVPEILATALNHLRGRKNWRDTRVQRVTVAQRSVLESALRSIENRRVALCSQLADLKELESILTLGVTAGVVSIENASTGATTNDKIQPKGKH